MEIGREAAISYIENKEREFLQYIINQTRKPQLIAAGPFLVVRDGWNTFIEKMKPFIIHLDKHPDAIYQGLLQRREKQKSTLDTSNHNFGSWDKDVTTQLSDGTYQDISNDSALENINGHLSRINPVYQKNRHVVIDSESLKVDRDKQQELIDLIINNLRQNRS